MVSQPTNLTQTEDLPALTDWEAELLAHFLILRYDMVTLAETRKLNAHQLLAFARSRAVQAHLAELRKFADTAFALRALESRIAAIDTLETVAKNSTDLVEKRRAASAILRGLNPSFQGGTRPGGTPLGGTPLRGVRNSPSRLPQEHPSTNDFSNPSSELPSTTPPPTPSILPSPKLSHREVAEIAVQSILAPHLPQQLATLNAFLTPDATIAREPISDLATQVRALKRSGTYSQFIDHGPRHDEPNIRNYKVVFHKGPSRTCFTLTRASAESPWLISQIHHDSS